MGHTFGKTAKRQKSWVILVLAMIFLPTGISSGVCYAEEGSESSEPDHYAIVLKTYVDDKGMVNYEELKAHREPLDTFIEHLEKLPSAVYDGWSKEQKIAFWINAYNGFTLKAIIDHYPIKGGSFLSKRRFPKNSIRQIKGVWDKLELTTMGRKLTLNDIEHEILRKEFNEPRIHMALVCAAMSCPPLRDEPYTGEKLDEQLDDQARKFLKDPLKFRIDREKERVYVSSIFKWFGKDFVPTYGADDRFKEYEETDRAVLSFVSRYLESETQEYLAAQELSVKHLDYDWSLNE